MVLVERSSDTLQALPDPISWDNTSSETLKQSLTLVGSLENTKSTVGIKTNQTQSRQGPQAL